MKNTDADYARKIKIAEYLLMVWFIAIVVAAIALIIDIFN